MAAHRIGAFVFLACALSTAPFGSMEQGSPTAAHAVAGAKAASWAPPAPTKDRILTDAPGSAESWPDDAPPPSRAPNPWGGLSVAPASAIPTSANPWRGSSPYLTYWATAPPPQHAS